ncbi:MAG: precorrin-3B synthase [Alphaproteobacteria bacterium]|nr:precorrin-3B synthase [Alphaproteobacteria bacterium]
MRRGACPTVFAPMRTGDGLLARVKPPGSRLSAAQARALADAAAACGNGVIELTARGNIQVRGLTTTSAPRFAHAMVAAGLAAADPQVERRRNVLLAPLADAPTRAVAAALEARLADAALAALPGKFGFIVDGGGGLPLDSVSGDVRLRADGGRWRVWCDGAQKAATGDATAAVAIALRLAEAFLALRTDAKRMRDAVGSPILARATAELPSVAAPVAAAAPSCIGPLRGGFGVGLPFGATDAATFAALGALWVTPWRAVVIENASPRELRGLITDPSDPRRALAACPGRPACDHARADTRADAAKLAALLPGLRAHLSGCAKGCAHPAPAPVTLVARDDGYALVRDGCANDAPERTGLALGEAVALLQR